MAESSTKICRLKQAGAGGQAVSKGNPPEKQPQRRSSFG
jgi:hypothetical protein